MLGAVCGLGEECEGKTVLEYVSALGDDLLVLLHGSISIADTEDGEHLEEGEYLLHEGFAEDIGTGHEDGGAIHRTQDDQRVEQCAGVVTADDDGSVLGQVLFALDDQAAC